MDSGNKIIIDCMQQSDFFNSIEYLFPKLQENSNILVYECIKKWAEIYPKTDFETNFKLLPKNKVNIFGFSQYYIFKDQLNIGKNYEIEIYEKFNELLIFIKKIDQKNFKNEFDKVHSNFDSLAKIFVNFSSFIKKNNKLIVYDIEMKEFQNWKHKISVLKVILQLYQKLVLTEDISFVEFSKKIVEFKEEFEIKALIIIFIFI